MPTKEVVPGVSNCYVFKSRLQEYTQKAGLPTPVYETTKEGPSHEPSFSSQVTVNDTIYKSLPGFFNRKAAEQSAAEVALLELGKGGEVEEHMSQPILETGLCKNLVQEYAQKMNYAIPIYQCEKVEATGSESGRLTRFCCTVEIGGIRYIGGTARTKKEAEIKAARTALLAIQITAPESSDKPIGNSQFTVIPCKKRAMESDNKPEETASVPRKTKKARFMKKKMLKRKIFGDKTNQTQIEAGSNSDFLAGTHQEGSEGDQTYAHGVQTEGSAEAARIGLEGRSDVEPNDGDITTPKGTFARHISDDSQNMLSNATYSNQSNHKESDVGKSSVSNEDITALTEDMNETIGSGEMASMVTMVHTESSCAIDVEPNNGDITTPKGTFTHQIPDDSQNMLSNATDSKQSNHKEPDVGKSSVYNVDITASSKEMNETTGSGERASMVTLVHVESSCAIDVEPNDGYITAWKGTFTHHIPDASQNVQSYVADSKQSNQNEPDAGKSFISDVDITASTKEMNEATGSWEMASKAATLVQAESSCAIAGLSQPQERIQTSAGQL